MAELVNLNSVRKSRTKMAEKAKAETNRQLHGLTKGERQRLKAERERADRLLDQARRED